MAGRQDRNTRGRRQPHARQAGMGYRHLGKADVGAVTVTYTEQKADGSKGAAIVAGWDLKGAKAL